MAAKKSNIARFRAIKFYRVYLSCYLNISYFLTIFTFFKAMPHCVCAEVQA